MNDTTEPSLETSPPDSRRVVRRTLILGLVLLGILLVAASLRLLANTQQTRALAQQTQQALQRTVTTTRAQLANGSRNVGLSATLRGFEESIIYARTGGYVTSWRHTIGDRVRAGEILAELSAPELEQELQQVRAAQEQFRAQEEFSATTLARWETQLQSGVVSRQAFEEKRSGHRQAQSNLAAAVANVRRVEGLLALQRVRAPFDGVITSRGVDVGALVTPGSTMLFSMAQTDRLRLTVGIPQTYANEVRPGQQVTVTVDELPGRRFNGLIAHVSGGLDSASRTRQIEVIVPNKENRLLPGAYARVNLDLSSAAPALLIPPNALLFGKDGTRLVVVDAGNRLHLRTVRLGRDLGRELEILEGITADDRLVLNPSDSLQEGELVRVQQPANVPEQK